MSRMTLISITGAVCLFLIAFAAIALIGRPDVALAISMGTLGIVVAGKELDGVKSLEDLQEVRNTVVKKMGELRDAFNGRADKDKGTVGRFEGEENQQWNDADTHIKAIDERMKQLRDSSHLENRWKEIQEGENRDLRNRQQNLDINDPNSGRIREITPDDRRDAFNAWGRCLMELPVTRAQKKACKKLRFNPRQRRLNLRPNVRTHDIAEIQQANTQVHRSLRRDITHRAMSAITATEGQEFVPQGFMTMLEEALFLHANIRNVVDVMRTDSGNPLPWPTASDQDEGEWLAASTAVAEADPDTDDVLFGAHKVSSKLIKCPQEFIEDSAFNLANWLPTVLGRRIGRAVNKSGTVGDGSGQLTGLVPSSTLGHTAAAIGALAYTDFVRLEHSVDPLDRANAGYMFHDNIVLLLRLLLDGDGRPLWQPGIQLGVPDRFNGRPIEVNQYMDSVVTASKKPVLFGNFMKYKLREVRSIRIYRLEELYREKDQDGFVAFQRFDGKLLDAGTHPIRHMIMPAS